MLVAEKVVKLDNTKVYDEIIRYLDRVDRKSKNTRISYENDIRLFFQAVRGKQIEHLSFEDMNVTLDDMEDFIKTLKKAKNKKGEKIYKNDSINRKVSAIKEMCKYLKAKNVIDDISFLPLVENLKSEKESYDAFKVEEVLKLAELASQEKSKSLEKKLIILFAMHTGLRKSEILSVKWKDFSEIESGIVQIKGVGKGKKKFKRYILKEFYEELTQLQESNRKLVFSLPEVTLSKMFERLRDKLDIRDNRLLVFHSIRKTSATFLYKKTNDINLVRKVFNHSNITTTQIYLGDDNDDEVLKSIVLSDRIDKDLYLNVGQEVLLKAISELDDSQKLLLNKKIMEMLNENE